LFNYRPQGPRNEPPPEKRREIARLFQLGVPAARVILPKRCDGKHLLGAILENVELDSIVYSDGRKAHNKLSLNGFHHKRINHDKTLVDGKVPINGIENFRGYAKRRLKAYHGGFKHSFELFIRERPLSFSHRDDKKRLTTSGGYFALIDNWVITPNTNKLLETVGLDDYATIISSLLTSIYNERAPWE